VTPPGTTTKPPTTSKPAPTPAKPPTKKAPVSYKVQHNDTLSSLATKYHVAGGWETLWKYNTTKGNRPADTIAELIKRGPNLLYSGETILIPQS
jgi:nucleoid-associated protein YgaU